MMTLSKQPLEEIEMSVVSVSGDSPEAVALVLLSFIADAEGMVYSPSADKSASRKWILDTYAECLKVVKNPSGPMKISTEGLEAVKRLKR